jgi:hypothetical protein
VTPEERQAAASHEAAHVIGARWLEPGTKVVEVWIDDNRLPGVAGMVEVDRPWGDGDGVSLAQVLVSSLLGWLFDPSLPAGLWPPSYEEAKEDVGKEHLALLIDRGGITELQFYRLTKIALELADDLRFRVDQELIAYELERKGRLTGDEIEELLRR